LKSYIDTSFLASLYLLDANSKQAIAAISESATMIITPLCEIEFLTAVEQRVFWKEINQSEAYQAYHAFQSDIQDGIFHMHPLSTSVLEKAKQISKKQTSQLGCRTLDILHVASALICKASVFFTFDVKQEKLAKAAGLTVK
jgi:predicted nucleic acid-binding protein